MFFFQSSVNSHEGWNFRVKGSNFVPRSSLVKNKKPYLPKQTFKSCGIRRFQI